MGKHEKSKKLDKPTSRSPSLERRHKHRKRSRSRSPIKASSTSHKKSRRDYRRSSSPPKRDRISSGSTSHQQAHRYNENPTSDRRFDDKHQKRSRSRSPIKASSSSHKKSRRDHGRSPERDQKSRDHSSHKTHLSNKRQRSHSSDRSMRGEEIPDDSDNPSDYLDTALEFFRTKQLRKRRFAFESLWTSAWRALKDIGFPKIELKSHAALSLFAGSFKTENLDLDVNSVYYEKSNRFTKLWELSGTIHSEGFYGSQKEMEKLLSKPFKTVNVMDGDDAAFGRLIGYMKEFIELSIYIGEFFKHHENDHIKTLRELKSAHPDKGRDLIIHQ